LFESLGRQAAGGNVAASKVGLLARIARLLGIGS